MRAMQPVEAEVATLTGDLVGLEQRRSRLEYRIESLLRKVTELPDSVSAAAEHVDAARAAAPASAQAHERVEVLEGRVAALVRAAELKADLASADNERRSAIDDHQTLQQHWLDLHEHRLNGMAAEIASALAVGASCPVCGSCDHPHPASSAPGAPTSAEEKAARKRVDTAAAIREAHEDRVRTLDTALAVARAHAGAADPEAVEAELAAARSEYTRLAGLAAGLEAHELAARVAAFVEGKSADNGADAAVRLRPGLAATQVVAAANQRLLRMSDQRYTLEHTGRRGAGETRGGLSLLVRDEWSGEARDPATLSGGETFVVSLALALGLADVVTAEAGGADLDTLFVDEGFGALDADTLDDVMGTLDGLRDGGRVVGVVSHVGELRTRIPTQLVDHQAACRFDLRVGRSRLLPRPAATCRP